jgi:outer membrane protein assembly factor BamB
MMKDTRRLLARRTALLLPLAALPGCSVWDDWFGIDKPPLPGTRVAVIPPRPGLDVSAGGAPRKVVLPPPASNADWPQSGGVPSHDMGHPALRDAVARAWSANVGTGGGYRRKLTAQPIVAGGRVFAMDSDAVISAFDTAGGRLAWSVETQAEDSRSTNVGGGIASDGGVIYAATGRADLLAIEAATGKIQWRVQLPTGARSAPTIAEDKLFVPTEDNQVSAWSKTDGKQLWSYQGGTADALVLGLPAPAYVNGLVVTGFGSGELVVLRAASGTVSWADSLAASRGRTSLSDLSAIRARPVVHNGIVYAVGMGRQLVSLDLRSGRRLWEREVASQETPWVAGEWLFVVSEDGEVAAVACADGVVAWTTQLDQFENMEKKRDPIRWVGPVLAGDRLVVAGSQGVALSISPYTGKILGQQKLSDPIAVAPIVAGETLYILTDDATLTAYR